MVLGMRGFCVLCDVEGEGGFEIEKVDIISP